MDNQKANAKSKITLYIRPELHKLLKLRSVQDELNMSVLAEKILERYLLEFHGQEPIVCPGCQMKLYPKDDEKASSPKLPVGST